MKVQSSWWQELCFPLIITTIILALLGCYNLHSAAAAHSSQLYLAQASWFALGTVLMLWMIAFDYRLTENIAYIFYSSVIAALTWILLFGRPIMGAKRWLMVFGSQCQPSEFAKIAVILGLARYFSSRQPPGGYTIAALLRPLHLSRPIGSALLLLFFWKNPYLVDPIGSFLRLVKGNLPSLPLLQPSQWWWWRLGLLLIVVAAGLVGWRLTVDLGWGRRQEETILTPQATQNARVGRDILLLLGIMISGIGFWIWQLPFAELQPLDTAAAGHLLFGIVCRVLLVGLIGLYLIAALLHHGKQRLSLGDRLVAPVDLLMLPVVLVLVEPDLGTATIIFLIGMSMILIVGIRLRSLLLMSALAVAVVGLAWYGILKNYQKRRIMTFLDPEHDIRGAGWNAVQSLIAVGSGRWLGKGHLGGTQTQLSFLPEQHTDFAFSVWAEEQGFVGCSVVVMLYLTLLLIGLHIATSARDAYGALLATGIVALIAWQVMINIAMVSGALPVVGITLPLFSYGGSSMITVMLAIGLLLNIHLRRRPH